MKKILFLFLVATMVFTSSCAAKKDLNALEAAKKAGEIKIGTEGTYAPFTYHDESGKLVGYDVEVAEAIAQKIGVKATFVETKWDSLIAGLDVNQYEAVFNSVGINDERQKKYDFTEPYAYSQGAIIIKKDDTTINSLAELKGKKSAQSVTSNYGKQAEGAGATIVPVDGFAEAVDLVISGRADATINDNVTYYDYIKHHPDSPIKIVSGGIDVTVTAAIINKNEPELKDAMNKALQELKSDGTLKEISIKYFGEDISVK